VPRSLSRPLSGKRGDEDPKLPIDKKSRKNHTTLQVITEHP